MIIMMDGWLGNELGKVGRVGFFCVKIPIVLFYCLEDEILNQYSIFASAFSS